MSYGNEREVEGGREGERERGREYVYGKRSSEISPL